MHRVGVLARPFTIETVCTRFTQLLVVKIVCLRQYTIISFFTLLTIMTMNSMLNKLRTSVLDALCTQKKKTQKGENSLRNSKRKICKCLEQNLNIVIEM